MAGKALPQSLSLKEREEPLVQTVDHNGVPYVKSLASVFSNKFGVSGTVTKVTPKSVTVMDKNEKEHTTHLVDNLPYNEKGYHDDEPHNFKPGDNVLEGQGISDNNYTKNGNLALGKNLHVAYIPWKGSNHEDGIVVSRSTANSMTSNHAYKFSYTSDKNTTLDANKFKSQFQRKYTPKQLLGFGPNGIPKKGRVLEYGDPIALIMEDREVSDTDKVLGRLHKSLISAYRDSSIIWDHHELGTIVDVDFTGRDIRILVRSEKKLDMGD